MLGGPLDQLVCNEFLPVGEPTQLASHNIARRELPLFRAVAGIRGDDLVLIGAKMPGLYWTPNVHALVQKEHVDGFQCGLVHLWHRINAGDTSRLRLRARPATAARGARS